MSSSSPTCRQILIQFRDVGPEARGNIGSSFPPQRDRGSRVGVPITLGGGAERAVDGLRQGGPELHGGARVVGVDGDVVEQLTDHRQAATTEGCPGRRIASWERCAIRCTRPAPVGCRRRRARMRWPGFVDGQHQVIEKIAAIEVEGKPCGEVSTRLAWAIPAAVAAMSMGSGDRTSGSCSTTPPTLQPAPAVAWDSSACREGSPPRS